MRSVSPIRSVLVRGVAATVGLVACPSASAGDAPASGSWSTLAGGVTGFLSGVRALAVFDDGWGDGPVVYAAGSFTTAGSVAAASIARWDGRTWTDVGGLTSAGSGGAGYANAMTIWPSPEGDVLVVAGSFGFAGGVAVTNIAAWDGRSWSPLGAGLGSHVPGPSVPTDLAVHIETDPGDGRSTARLYAAGAFQNSGMRALSPGVVRYDDGLWTQVGPEITSASLGPFTPPKFCFHDDGDGARPYMAGSALTSDGVLLGPLATLDGEAWVAVNGLHPSPGAVWSLHSQPIDGVDHLFVGGTMGLIGVADRDGILVRSQGAWSILGNGVRGRTPFTVTGIHPVADGLGDALGPGLGGGRGSDERVAIYIGGQFAIAGGTPAANVARWNGTFWTPLADGVGTQPASELEDAAGDDGAPQALTVLPPRQFSMVLDPFGPASAPRIIVAGEFKFAGDQQVNHIAMWTPPEAIRPGPFRHTCAYELDLIPMPFTPRALTDNDLVAGVDSGESFVVVNGTLTQILPPPPAYGLSIHDVNEAHVAVGALLYERPAPGGQRGFRLDLKSGEWTIFDADSEACNGCHADAIGNDGTIFGWYQGAMYVWVDGVRSFPPLEPGWGWMRARGANAFGEAVGTGLGRPGQIAPTHFDGSTIGPLPHPAGFSGGQARRINDQGTIIGIMRGGSGDVGAIWEQGIPSPLPGLDGYPCLPTDLNNAGVIVGRSVASSSSTGSRPVIWIDGMTHSLQEFVDWRATWRFDSPARINEVGTILAYWSPRPFTTEFESGVLLRPRPEVGGDVDGDCRVNEYDLGLVLVEFGFRDSVADLDGDGVVDGADLGLVLSNWAP